MDNLFKICLKNVTRPGLCIASLLDHHSDVIMGTMASHITEPHDCLLYRLYWRRSKKTSKLRVTGLCVGNSLVTGEFPAQMASNAENVPIWWRHHDEKSFWNFAQSTPVTEDVDSERDITRVLLKMILTHCLQCYGPHISFFNSNATTGSTYISFKLWANWDRFATDRQN